MAKGKERLAEHCDVQILAKDTDTGYGFTMDDRANHSIVALSCKCIARCVDLRLGLQLLKGIHT